MSILASCIYEGQIRHRRYQPRAHEFRYPLFMMYLDLAELPQLFRGTRLWSLEGRGLARFRRRDHLKQHADSAAPLDEAVRNLVTARLGRRPAGPIRLLTHLEYFGYRFNPVSFFYCFDESAARLDALVAEINNTPWGEQHCYVLDAAAARLGSERQMRFRFAKDFHISPFMPMDLGYDWRFALPAHTLSIHMENLRGAVPIFDATLTLHRREISAARLNRLLLRYPFMTLRVIGSIHWQALWLWLKRCPVYPHPRWAEKPARSAAESA